MNENYDRLDVMTRVPALAKSEDVESTGTDYEDPELDDSPPVIIDRYGFSGGQQYTDPSKQVLFSLHLTYSI